MKNDLGGRTLEFAIQVAIDVNTLPRTTAGSVTGRQLMKAAGSIGANYREAGRAESKPDFIHKVGIAEKEAAETEYWLLISERVFPPAIAAAKLINDSRQLLAILTTIGRKAKLHP